MVNDIWRVPRMQQHVPDGDACRPTPDIRMMIPMRAVPRRPARVDRCLACLWQRHGIWAPEPIAEMPPWRKGDHQNFVLLHAQVLEQGVVWQRLRQMAEEGAQVDAVVESTRPAGLIVKIFGSISGFVPGSHTQPVSNRCTPYHCMSALGMQHTPLMNVADVGLKKHESRSRRHGSVLRQHGSALA